MINVQYYTVFVLLFIGPLHSMVMMMMMTMIAILLIFNCANSICFSVQFNLFTLLFQVLTTQTFVYRFAFSLRLFSLSCALFGVLSRSFSPFYFSHSFFFLLTRRIARNRLCSQSIYTVSIFSSSFVFSLAGIPFYNTSFFFTIFLFFSSKFPLRMSLLVYSFY